MKFALTLTILVTSYLEQANSRETYFFEGTSAVALYDILAALPEIPVGKDGLVYFMGGCDRYKSDGATYCSYRSSYNIVLGVQDTAVSKQIWDLVLASGLPNPIVPLSKEIDSLDLYEIACSRRSVEAHCYID